MKIDSITLHELSMPLVSPFETSFGRQINRECILVEVHADGLTGWGEAPVDDNPGYCYETTKTAWHILHDFLVPAVLGKEVPDPKALAKMLHFVRGHPMAKSGLEMALWDLKGRAEAKSLREQLGGVRDRADVGVSVGLQESPAALVKTVEGYLKDGYGRVKIKIKPGRDAGDAGAVRTAFPDLKLQVDANSAYSLETADALLPLDALEMLLIEQPLHEDDMWDHAKLQPRFKTPLCLDESIISPRHAAQALEMGACRVINIKQSRVGGIANAVEIHDHCLTKDVPVWCGGMLETGIGRAANLALATLPNFALPGDISATDRYYDRDITHEKFLLNPDSTITAPDGPGLGVSIDMEALALFTARRVRITGI